jgi:hypothetical protein
MKRALALLAASVAATASAAQGAPFADPMRPPSVFEAGPSEVSIGGPRLESVLIAPDRRIAVISGQQVGVGGRIGAGEVVRITETEVQIRGADGIATLRLVPDFAKRPPQPPGKRMQP